MPPSSHHSFLAIPLILAAALLSAGPARAATLDLIGSTLEVQIYGATTTIPQQPASLPVSVSPGGGFSLPASVFAVSTVLPTELFTGVPLIATLRLTFANASGTISPGAGPGGGVGGVLGIDGSQAFRPLGGCCFFPPTPLTPVGRGGVATGGAAALNIFVTGAPWTAGTARVTAVTVTTAGGGFLNTVTATGSDARSVGFAGTLTLVTPVRILSNAIGGTPGFFTQTLRFVPEPGTGLLLGVAALFACWKGLRRRR